MHDSSWLSCLWSIQCLHNGLWCLYVIIIKMCCVILKEILNYHWKDRSEWVVVFCLTLVNNFAAVSWREQVTYKWDDNDVCWLLDQHTELPRCLLIVLANWNTSSQLDMKIVLNEWQVPISINHIMHSCS